MRKSIKEKLIYFTLAILSCVGVMFLSCPGILNALDCECGEPANVWYKVSTFEPDRGKIVRLDMRKGQAFSDHQYIYISVKDLDTGEVVYIAFPNGGDWVAEPEKDEFLDAMEEEFKNLEDYLRSREGTEIKRKQK